MNTDQKHRVVHTKELFVAELATKLQLIQEIEQLGYIPYNFKTYFHE